MKAIIGTKVGMTNLFSKNGKSYATTIIHVEPNLVLGTKTQEKDGFVATQLAYKEVKEKSKNKPDLGQFKKIKASARHIIKEFRNVEGYNPGDLIKCDIFTKGEYVNITGTSKGHGFTGSIKRHNFSVGPLGHGAGYPHRYVGSISGGRGGSQAQRVFKGTELPGHYGHEKVTIENLVILDVLLDKNLILVKGAIPGPKNSYVFITESKKKKNKTDVIELVDLSVKEKQSAPAAEEARVEETQTQSQETPAEQPKVDEQKQEEKEAASQNPASNESEA